ncbi:hypothetical protein C4D60_Mb06t25660 [Musa balbisiana]|uniref:Myb-like domain-containing protein n=1 Tax=Musa balbisiana TaxID=52838 RepID=A0A4S8IQL8_MUSBA|nr:hypothetical protein C4D60_Mb06t25660 [Musa balbisiana]
MSQGTLVLFGGLLLKVCMEQSSDEEQKGFSNCHKDFENVTAVPPYDNLHSDINGNPSFSWMVVNNSEVDIPEWRSNNHIGDYEDFASTLPSETTPPSSNHVVDEVESDRWVGTCAMPLPESALLASNVLVLQCKDCGCPDEGSIRCVRQHVMETREKLKKKLGQDKFIELGFGDMGEVVAQKWTEEEEQLFHEIVLSNPASLGKNFWDKLPQVFPARSSKELASYYFNVFMLRKRAKQNRLDPLHVDSDDDEWQESHHGEFATGEDEDSVVESPLEDEYDDAGEEDETEEEEMSETADDVENCDFYALARNNEKGTCGAVKGCIFSRTNLISNMQFTESSLYNCTEEQDIQDDSCTSFEGQHNGSDSCDPLGIFDLQHGLNEDHDFCKEYQNDSLSRLTDDGFYDGHCDPKAWDMSYSCGAEKDDFLSTNNLIEEVFGKEPGDNK